MNFGNKMVRLFGCAAGSAVLVLLAGCAGDRSQAQYQSQLAEQNLASAQAVSGDYAGVGTDNQGHNLVAMKAHLAPAPQGTTSTNCSSTDSLLIGSISFDGVITAHEIGITNGCYDVNNNSFNAQLNIPTTDGPYGSTVVSIKSQLGGGNFSGTIDVNSITVEQLHFNVQMGGQASVSDYASSLRAQQLSTLSTGKVSFYQADAVQTKDGPMIPVMIFQNPGTSADAQLFNLLSPSRLISITFSEAGPFKYSDGKLMVMSVQFINGGGGSAHIDDIYDANSNFVNQTITASTGTGGCASGSSCQEQFLSCSSNFSVTKGNGFLCSQTNMGGTGTFSNVQFYQTQNSIITQ